MVLPEILGKDFMHQIIRIVLIHLDLFQNHALFAGNVLGIESWIEDQVAQNVDGNRQMLIQDFNVEADGFFAGEGVHVAADGIHLAGNVTRRACLGPFKDHVLGEVRNAIQLRRLIARTGLHPNSNGNGTDVGHLFTQHD